MQTLSFKKSAILYCLITLFCCLATGREANAAWEQLYPDYPTHGYNDIYVAGANNAFAVGMYGLISHYDGSAWSTMTSPVSDSLNAVWGRSGNDIFAVGDNGTIIHYNGASWQLMNTPTSGNLHSVWGLAGSSNPVYAGGRDGNILKYAGGSWSFMHTGLADGIWDTVIIYGIWGYAADNLYAVGYRAGDTNEDIFLQCTDGSNWTAINNFPGSGFWPTAIWGFSGGLMYIAGDDGIYSLTNGAGTWARVLTDSNGIANIWGSAASDIWAVGDSIYYFNGSTWDTIISNVDPQNQWGGLKSVSGSSGSNVLAVGSSGRILLYRDSAWSSMTTIPEYPVRDMWADSDTSLCAVGDNGLTIRYTGSGGWTPMASASNKDLVSICGWGNGHFLAVGIGGTVQYYNGSSWSLISSGTAENLHDTWCLAPDSAYVVGANGKILHCDGTGCTGETTDGTTSSLNAVYSSILGSYAAGTGGVLMRKSGASWNQVSPTNPITDSITDLWGDPAFGGMVAVSDNLIYSFNIGTNTWTLEYNHPDTLHLFKVTGSSFATLLAAGYGGPFPYSGMVLQRTGGTFQTIRTFSGYYPYTIQETPAGNLYLGGAQQDQNSSWHGQVLHYNGSSWTGMIETTGLEPLLAEWLTSKPDDVVFTRMPAVLGPSWELYGKAYYTAEFLGVQDKIHQALFSALHTDRKKISDEAALQDLFVAQGVSAEDFRNTFNSFAVSVKLNNAKQMTKRYAITGVPTVIINGKYSTSASQAGSNENIIKVMDFLIAQERQQDAAEAATANR